MKFKYKNELRPPAARRKAKPGAACCKSGLTLVELMVGMLVGLMVLAAAVAMNNMASRSVIRQEQSMNQTQNLRACLLAIARDVRAAGSGYGIFGDGKVRRVHFYDTAAGAWFKHEGYSRDGAFPIYGENGGSSGADSLTVVYLTPEYGTMLGNLSAPLAAGANKIVTRAPIDNIGNEDDIGAIRPGDYNSGAMRHELIAKGDKLVVVSPAGEAVVVEFDGGLGSGSGSGNIWDMNYDIKQLPSNLPAGASFPAGSEVYNMKSLKAVTYFVKDDYLMARYHGLDLGEESDGSDEYMVSSGIEDMQVYYYQDGQDISSLTAGTHDLSSLGNLEDNPVTAVRIALVSKSDGPDINGRTYSPVVPLFDHTTAGPADGHHRRVLSETIVLRNQILNN